MNVSLNDKSGNYKNIIDILSKKLKDNYSANITYHNIAYIFIIIIYILIFVFCGYYISIDRQSAKYALSAVMVSSTILFYLIIIGLLSIIFYALNNFINSFTNKQQLWVRFIKDFIFYIPCLLIDFVNYIINEFSLTTSPIFILFIFELCFILGYIYLYEFIDLFITPSEPIYILKHSRFLNEESKKTIPYEFYIDNNLISVISKKFRQNYAISLWIYLNNSVNNSGGGNIEKNIVSIDSYTPIKLCVIEKPRVNDPNKIDQFLRIYFNYPDDYYDIIIPFQKWIYLVFNYESSKFDLFVNGNLERTIHIISPNYPPASSVIIGENHGLSGAISNIIYYPHVLTKYEITNSYNIS